MKILIVIPAFNEEGNIESVVERMIDNYPQYDYVVINDCSVDKTEMVCRKNSYNYVSLPVNLGIGGAVQCGYRYALDNGYDAAVQFDGDGQHNTVSIETLLQPIIDNNADMVVGSRFINREGYQSSVMRRLGIWIIAFVIKMCCGIKVTDATSGFRAVNRKLIKLFAKEYAHDYPEPEAIVSAVLNGYRVTETPVVMNERTSGESSINKLRSIYYMLKVPLALVVYRLSIKKMKQRNGGVKVE